MITTGLVKEFQYIATVFKCKMTVEINVPEIGIANLWLTVTNDVLEVNYGPHKIWREKIDDNSFFGIESCDTISRIISCINNNDPTWKDYILLENLDTPAKE